MIQIKKYLGILGLTLVSTLQAQTSLNLVIPRIQGNQIKLAIFSPDSRMVVTVATDNSAKLWHAQTGALLAELEGTGETNTANMFSSAKVYFRKDIKRLIIGDNAGKKIRLWNCTNGTFIRTIAEVADEFIVDYGFTTDNKYIFVTTAFHGVMLFDSENGKLVKSIKSPDFGSSVFYIPGKNKFLIWKDGSDFDYLNPNGSVTKGLPIKSAEPLDNLLNEPCFSADGNTLCFFSSDWDKIVCIHLKTGETFFEKNENGTYRKLHFESSGMNKEKLLAFGNNTIVVFNNVLNKINSFKMNRSDVTHASLSDDGNKLLAFNESELICWNLNSSEVLLKINNQDGTLPTSDFISSAFFSPPSATDTGGSNTILIANWHNATLFDLKSKKSIISYEGAVRDVYGLRPSPDGAFAARISLDPTAGMRIMDLRKATEIPVLKEESEIVYYASFGNNVTKKRLLTISTDHTIRVWNWQTNTLIAKWSNTNDYILKADFDNADEKIVCIHASGSQKVLLIDTKASIEISRKNPGAKNSKSMNRNGFGIISIFNNDGSKVLCIDRFLGEWSIWNANTGVEINKSAGKDTILAALFLREQDKDVIVYVSGRGFLRKISETGEELKSVKLAEGGIYSLISGNNKSLLVLDALSAAAYLYDIHSFNQLATIQHEVPVSAAIFNPENDQLALGFYDGKLQIYNNKTGELLKTFNGHAAKITDLKFVPNAEGSRLLMSVSEDKSCKIWSTGRNEELLSWYSLIDGEYLIKTPDGYYSGSKNAPVYLHYTTDELQVISFEQLDTKFNRPDRILRVLNPTDSILIQSFEQAYNKRLKRLAINPAQLKDDYNIPQAVIANRDFINFNLNNERLQLQIQCLDTQYKLDRFNIWVNEVPVNGQKGINILSRNRNRLDTGIAIILSNGENRIEMSVMNTNGMESYRMPLIVNYSPHKPVKNNVYFIGMGMDRFVDESNNLRYSTKDIRDLANAMKNRFGDTLIIDTLFNENFSAKNIQKIKQKLLKTNVNDKVIVAYSGHGLLSKDLDYYLSTYTVDFENPEKNGLPYETLENLLDSIPARQKLMLIDACHSGEVDKEEHRQIENIADSLGLSKGAKVKNTKATSTKHLGLENSFELMQNLFVNVSKGTGATVISASGGTQFALERGSLKNGVFTYSILEAMNNYTSMTVSQLKTTVGNRVVELTGGMQKPTSRSETLNNDWRVW